MFLDLSVWLLYWTLARPGVATPQETLPPPRGVAPALVARPVPSPFQRTGWRPLPPEPLYGYARDRYGYLRPRIVLGPHGTAHYPLTGQHYPFYPIRTAP